MLDVMAPQGDPSQGLSIRIYRGIVEDKKESKDKGYPVFKDVPYIQIRIPGDPTYERNGPITDEEKRLYPRHWARYSENETSEGVVGQILEEWSVMPRSLVETFRHFGVRTVEQLAQISDVNAKSVPQATQWKAKAVAWLATAKEAAPFSKLEADNKALENRVQALQDQLSEAMKALDQATAPRARKVG